MYEVRDSEHTAVHILEQVPGEIKLSASGFGRLPPTPGKETPYTLGRTHYRP
jgi:hypothetical protein